MAAKKKDRKRETSNGSVVGARVHNGRPKTVNSEAQTIVRGPKALLDGMAAAAAAQGMPLAEAWRRAAALWLSDRS